MQVTFLGTGGARPTVDRNPSAVLVEIGGERLLFDVGEGTQRQMVHFADGVDVSAIFVTHLHGDHILGLPGLLRTLDRRGRTDTLPVYTPRGTKAYIQELATVGRIDLDFPVAITGIGSEAVIDRPTCTVDAFETAHGTRARGYAVTRPRPDDGADRRVVYTGDTRPTYATVQAASGADLLVHDGMFISEHAERAQETGHSTVREAADVAQQAGVERLALTHVSSRYAGNISALEREATDAFGAAAFVADDGRHVELAPS